MNCLLAIDLGVTLHLAVCVGTSANPMLLETAKIEWRSEADTDAVVALIEEIVGRRGVTVIACEETFSAGDWLPGRRDVGRKQEGQAGFLVGHFSSKVRVMRVPYVDGKEAGKAFIIFGRPPEAKGEHKKDSLGVALRAIIRLEDERRRR